MFDSIKENDIVIKIGHKITNCGMPCMRQEEIVLPEETIKELARRISDELADN